MPVESCVQALSDLALRFGEDDDGDGGMVCFCTLTNVSSNVAELAGVFGDIIETSQFVKKSIAL